MMTASIFRTSDFDLLDGDVYSQELSYLQHQYATKSIGRVITIKGRHYRLEKTDRTPDGEIAGWWYYEIGGTGKVLIVND